MKKAIPPAIFKWRQTGPERIVCAVRWYLRYSLSFRDVEELVRELGLEADHTTTWRWVQRYGPELEERLRRDLKPTNKSWRVDETYVRVKGRWCYLHRAIDSRSASIDFVLSATVREVTDYGGLRHRQNSLLHFGSLLPIGGTRNPSPERAILYPSPHVATRGSAGY